MNISPPGENGNLSYHTSFYYLFTWVGTIPWGRARQPTPVSLPGVSRGQRSLAGYSPWGCKESDMTEQLNNKQQAADTEARLSWALDQVWEMQRWTKPGRCPVYWGPEGELGRPNEQLMPEMEVRKRKINIVY